MLIVMVSEHDRIVVVVEGKESESVVVKGIELADWLVG